MFVAALSVFIISLSPALVESGNYDYFIPADCQEVDIGVGRSPYQLQGYIDFYALSVPSRHPFNCSTTVNLVTRSDYRLSVRFQKLRLDCTRGAYVKISGYTNTKSYCGWWTNWPVLYSSANYLNISYFHGFSLPYTSEEVILYYTAYHEGECHDDDDDDDYDHHGSNSYNHGDEFRCWNDRCIGEDLKCDGIDNCGDWSDESMWTCGLTSAWVIAISVTCSILGLTLIVCITCACKKMKYRKNRTDSTSAPTTTANPSPTNVEEPTTAEIQGAMPAPPPYTYVNNMVVLNSGPTAGGHMSAAWAALYDEKALHDGLPPHYDDVSDKMTSNTHGDK